MRRDDGQPLYVRWDRREINEKAGSQHKRYDCQWRQHDTQYWNMDDRTK